MDERKQILKWEPDNFELQTTTVWSFPERGDWATHNAKYRGNWSPYIPRNLLLRYSQEGELVLDQFAGGGTTLVEAKLLNRNAIGVDINPSAVELCRAAIDFEKEGCGQVAVRQGDARNLDFLPDASVDFICTHPPYADIIRYSDTIDGDLSRLAISEFLEEMKTVAAECRRVIKKNRFCAVLIGDTRKKGHMVPIGLEVIKIFLSSGFKLKELIIKQQHNCRATGYWKSSSAKYNFLLISHEYLPVFRAI